MRRKQHLFMALISLAMIVALYLLCTGNSQFEEAALAQSARDERKESLNGFEVTAENNQQEQSNSYTNVAPYWSTQEQVEHREVGHGSPFSRKGMSCRSIARKYRSHGPLQAGTTPMSQLPPDSTSQAIQLDLISCSSSLGVSHQALRSNLATITEISDRASFFLSGIWAIAPRSKSIPELRTPCWYLDKPMIEQLKCMLPEEEQGLDELAFACLPYFFIAGFPKCGTSALHGALQEHSQVAKPQWKEPQWWTRGPLSRLNHSISFYETAVLTYFSNYIQATAMISNGATDTLSYDGSQSTVYDSNFFVNFQDYCAQPAVISRVLPHAKFVLLLRNPVSRLYSHYIFGCTARVGVKVSHWPAGMRENPAVHFHNEVLSDIEYLKHCIHLHSLYECVTANTLRGNVCGRVGLRLTIGIYYIHILKWLQFYPRENFLFLRTEDLEKNPRGVVDEVTNFLGIDRMSDETATKAFSKRYKYLPPVSDNPNIELKMRNETKRLLEEFYDPYNKMLSDLVEDSRFLWKD